MSEMGFALPGLPASRMASQSSKEDKAERSSQGEAVSETQFAIPDLPASALRKTEVENVVSSPSEFEEETSPPQARSGPPPKYPPLQYETPEWSSAPGEERYFEVLKNGQILSKSGAITKAFLIVGRLPICDIELEHASISRYHAIIQFKLDGSAYVYDLGSTHGTFVNKKEVPKRTYEPLRIGDMLRFGASSRIYILNGTAPEELEEDEETAAPPQRLFSRPPPPPAIKSEVTWGFGEDAVEDENEEEHQDMDLPDTETPVDESAYYHSDPRKALRIWLEGRGADMIFQMEEEGPGHNRAYTAKIELPVETEYGTPLQAVGLGHRKRAAENDAALNACVMLDKRGLLRGGRSEQVQKERKRRKEVFGDDDDDDDAFYDRTSKSSTTRKAKAAAGESAPETFESLSKKREEKMLEIQAIQAEIDRNDNDGETQEEDEIDEFMSSLRRKEAQQAKDALRRKIPPLRKELDRLDKLIKLVAPTGAAIPLPIPLSQPRTEAEDDSAYGLKVPAKVLKKVSEPSRKRQRSPEREPPKAHPLAQLLQESTADTVVGDSTVKTGKSSKSKGPDATQADPSPLATPEEDELVDPPAAAEAKAKRTRRTYGVMTASQAKAHDSVETEAMVDSLLGDKEDKEAVAKMNAQYGY